MDAFMVIADPNMPVVIMLMCPMVSAKMLVVLVIAIPSFIEQQSSQPTVSVVAVMAGVVTVVMVAVIPIVMAARMITAIPLMMTWVMVGAICAVSLVMTAVMITSMMVYDVAYCT
jgi:hypothetical protein